MKKPNILFVLSDQQRADTLGCYGQRLPVTPNLDRLAAEGVRYSHAFTCQPVCGPARSCLQTGLYATQTGCFVNGIALQENSRSLAMLLGDEGYQTAYAGKWHLASDTALDRNHHETSAVPAERRGGYSDYWMASDVLEFTSHGYDGYVHDIDGNKVEFTGYRTDCITDYAIRFLKNRDADRPFFLFLSHIEPHHQNDRDRYEGPDGSKERWKNYDVPKDLLCGDFEGDWKENYPEYLGCCNALDRNMGKLVDTLKDQGIYEDTVIIYTSDHGSHFKTRRGEYKRACFDSCLKIPLIIRGGSFLGGAVEPGLASLIHLPPTILAMAGVPVPPQMAEPPLQHMHSGDWAGEVYFEVSESCVGRGLRTGRYTYFVSDPAKDGWRDSSSDRYTDEYLFDNDADPCQQHNRAGDPAMRAVRGGLCERLKEKIRQVEKRDVEILPL